jgi:hypothetical protein
MWWIDYADVQETRFPNRRSDVLCRGFMGTKNNRLDQKDRLLDRSAGSEQSLGRE